MNRHLSVLALWARQTMGKVMALLAVMAAAETALFAWAVSRGLTRAIMDDKTCPAPVEDLFDFGKISWAYRIALALLFVLLLLSGTELRGGKKGYTLRRLRISEEAAVLWEGGYNALCFLLLWAVQAALALGFCLWYAGTLDPAYVSPPRAAAPGGRVPVGPGLRLFPDPGPHHRHVRLLSAQQEQEYRGTCRPVTVPDELWDWAGSDKPGLGHSYPVCPDNRMAAAYAAESMEGGRRG